VPYLIDEPSPFAPVTEWQEHLRRLQRIPKQDDPEVRAAVERALEEIGEHHRLTKLADAFGRPEVQALLAEWKQRGYPIRYADLNQVADLIGVDRRKASTRKAIMEAVEAAGIEIHKP
jgi:hypothetical protein